MFKTALSKGSRRLKVGACIAYKLTLLVLPYIKTVACEVIHASNVYQGLCAYINRFIYAGLDTELTCFSGGVH